MTYKRFVPLIGLVLFLVAGVTVPRVQAMPYRYMAMADTIVKDTTVIDTTVVDSLAADKKGRKGKKDEPKETEYEKILKKGGVVTEGLFTVRHVEDNYYFEVPDSLLGRMMLCVSRFTAVPQNFGKFAGEEINNLTFYFEQRDTAQLLMRQYVLSQVAVDGDNIQRTLEQSTIDPIVMGLKVIGRNKDNGLQMIDATPLFKSGSKLTSASSALSTTRGCACIC